MGKQKASSTILLCPECKKRFKIWRKTSKQKKKGHVKHMFCPYCRQTVGFIELKHEAISENGWLSLDGEVSFAGEHTIE